MGTAHTSITRHDGEGRSNARFVAERQRTGLAHIARLAAVGELSASIAHEISQPLCAILANAAAGENLLGAEQPSLAEIKQLLGEIRREGERASDIIVKLRELLSKRPIEMQSLDANDLVTNFLAFIAGTSHKREVTILTALARGLHAIHGDRVQLEQVLMNLFINAMEAMANMPPQRRHLIVSTASSSDGCVEVTVSDSGPGIAPECLSQLFDSFFSTKRDGMGLGLSIAQSIVQTHNGRLWAESRTDGAAFHFTIPPVTAIQPVTVHAAKEWVAA